MRFLLSLSYANIDNTLVIQDYKKNAFMEADLRCTSTIQRMEKQLRAACHASNANMDNVVKVCYLWIYFWHRRIRFKVSVFFFGLFVMIDCISGPRSSFGRI